MSDEQGARESFDDLNRVAMSLGLATLTALGFTAGYAIHLAGRGFALQILWAIGLFAGAAGLGFLFGIPKVLQGTSPVKKTAATDDEKNATPAAAEALPSYQQRVNTNLEEISDWLTKIIVGVTLVELKSLPPYAEKLANRVTSNLAAGGHSGFGLAMILGFGTLGFLFGYLVTRLYIQGALARAERELGQPDSSFREMWRSSTALLSAMTNSVRAKSPVGARSAAGSVDQETLDALTQLSNEYKAIEDSDWKTRTQRKNEKAAEMTRLAIEKGVSRDWLASQSDEPLLLTLAGMVQASPTPADAERLLTRARDVHRKHVQYWILQAMLHLLEQNLLTDTHREGLRSVLDVYEKTADAPLERLIRTVRRRIVPAIA